MGPQNLTVRCGKLSQNLSLPGKLFEHSDCYIPRAHWTSTKCWVLFWILAHKCLSFLRHSSVTMTDLLENHIFFLFVAGKLFTCWFKFTYKWCKVTFLYVKLKCSREIWVGLNQCTIATWQIVKECLFIKMSMWEVQLDCSLRMTACTSSGLKRWKLGFTLAMSTFAGVNCKITCGDQSIQWEIYIVYTSWVSWAIWLNIE